MQAPLGVFRMEHDSLLTIIIAGDSVSLILSTCEFSVLSGWNALRTTKDRLVGWIIGVDPMCLLCALSAETHEHLFFECTLLSGLMFGEVENS